MVSVHRLRADGFGIIERARPHLRHAEASLAVNHDEVAIITAAGVRMTAVNNGAQLSTFECVAACFMSRQSTCLVIVLYRTGLVNANFFVELSDVLDHLSTYVGPVILAGDEKIHLERVSDSITVEFNDLLASYGLVNM